jgi:type VI secretion system secreted protein Hcp
MACDNFMWFPEAAKGTLVGKGAKPEGETTDTWFASMKAMELKSVTFGIAQPETTGSWSTGAGAGKAKFEEFQVVKAVDKASVPLFNACCAGAHYPAICLAIRKSGGDNLVYLQYIFRMVFVTGIEWSGGGGEEAPTETVKFRFGAMGVQYIKQKADGTEGDKVQAAWSTVANKNTLDVPGLTGTAPSYITATQT